MPMLAREHRAQLGIEETQRRVTESIRKSQEIIELAEKIKRNEKEKN